MELAQKQQRAKLGPCLVTSVVPGSLCENGLFAKLSNPAYLLKKQLSR